MAKRDQDSELFQPAADPYEGKDGMAPQEVVGPTGCEASSDKCEESAGEILDGEVGDCDFLPRDEIHESMPLEEPKVVMAPDGMPEIVQGDPMDAAAPPMTYESLICVCDDRQYVEVFDEELSGEEHKLLSVHYRIASPAMIAPPWSRYGSDGSEKERRVFDSTKVVRVFGLTVADRGQERGGERYLLVRPIRPQCEHYNRQMFNNSSIPNPKEKGHLLVFRFCKARRSNGGAYMSLRDEAVYSCSLRSPADPDSFRRLEELDKRTLEERPHEVMVPAFGGFLGGAADEKEEDPAYD